MRVGAPGKSKDPFSVALDAMRDRLRGGRLVLGQPLTITDLAQELGLSATPVREALSRLAGERQIEDRRGRGYFAPRFEVSDLVELYGLRRLYIAEALGSMASRVSDGQSTDPGPVIGPEPADTIAHILDWVVASAGNRALFDAYRQVAERLAPAVRVEARSLPLAQEASALVAGLMDGPALGLALADLHERRQAHVTDLARAMRASANIATL